jgi:hypothetical protein
MPTYPQEYSPRGVSSRLSGALFSMFPSSTVWCQHDQTPPHSSSAFAEPVFAPFPKLSSESSCSPHPPPRLHTGRARIDHSIRSQLRRLSFSRMSYGWPGRIRSSGRQPTRYQQSGRSSSRRCGRLESFPRHVQFIESCNCAETSCKDIERWRWFLRLMRGRIQCSMGHISPT